MEDIFKINVTRKSLTTELSNHEMISDRIHGFRTNTKTVQCYASFVRSLIVYIYVYYILELKSAGQV